jgi:hypothetical protein
VTGGDPAEADLPDTNAAVFTTARREMTKEPSFSFFMAICSDDLSWKRP